MMSVLTLPFQARTADAALLTPVEKVASICLSTSKAKQPCQNMWPESFEENVSEQGKLSAT
jgi:hypothetical protein